MSSQPEPAPGVTASTGPGGTVTVSVVGDLDYETCGDLLRAVAAALGRRPDATVLHLDCSALETCDSMGLSTLLQLRRDSDEAGRRLLVESRPETLERILQITGTRDYVLTGTLPG